LVASRTATFAAARCGVPDGVGGRRYDLRMPITGEAAMPSCARTP